MKLFKPRMSRSRPIDGKGGGIIGAIYPGPRWGALLHYQKEIEIL